MRPTFRTLIAVATTGLVAAAGSAVAAPPKLGPNLVSNGSFEKSQFEAVSGVVAAANGGKGQPILPTDWTVEGASVLFDHSEGVFKEGKRGAAISGALGGGRQICDGSSGQNQCVPNPAQAATASLPLRPWWVTDAPIKVEAGKRYRFSTFAAFPSLGADPTVKGEGAETQVRWLDASGSVLKTVAGPSLIKADKRIIGWKKISADLVPPKGAVGAQLLLGHSNYTTTGIQVAYDVVTFARFG